MKFTWDGVSIRIASKLPKWLKIEPFINGSQGEIDPMYPAQAGYVILSCRNRFEHEAVDRMLDSLQLLMSLMNTYETRYARTISANSNWTAGQLRMGQFQFVFKERKFLGPDQIWYDPRYDERAWNDRVPNFDNYVKFLPFVRQALSTLSKHPLKRILVQALQIAQEGYESRDGNHRLLRFWTALEKLYVEDSARERSNQKVIDRASFADEEYHLSKWKLSHIANVRNEYVHSRGHEEIFMAQSQILREIFTRHMLHWIFQGRDFHNHKSLLDYVDLPRDNAALEMRRKMIRRRLNLNKRQDAD